MESQRLHATSVALPLPTGGYGALLLRGAAGSGKSDLALRLMESGAVLVADDQVLLRGDASGITVAPPPALEGLLEVRGQGIRSFPHMADVPLHLVVDLVPAESVVRMPEPAKVTLLGRSLRQLQAAPFEASAVAKVRQALLAAAEASLAADCRPDSAEQAVAAPQPAAAAAPDSTGQSPGTPARDLARDIGDKSRLILVTGMSGAGRTTALHILEDLGYEAIDNLPMDLLEQLVVGEAAARNLAIGIDCRTHRFSAPAFLDVVGRLRAGDSAAIAATLLFLDGKDEVLERRFTTTRRRHPLTLDRPLSDGILAERSLLAPLKKAADLMVDTSGLRPVDLQHLLKSHFTLAGTPGMAIFLQSFSYGRGLPRQADLVLDLRFLSNPFYQPDLRSCDGRDPEVGAFIQNDVAFAPFFDGLTSLLGLLLERYEDEGKTYLTIALGCTGGQHRSVFVAEKLASWARAAGHEVSLSHRELA
jgi:RNase adaptor protein for sRNA GlmZ degradation